MRMYNSVSGGVCSSAMALTYPKFPSVIVNTGGNLPEAWDNIYKLQKKRITILVLNSFTQGYPTYYDYIKNEKLKPFYMSCSDRAKQVHLNRFFKTVTPCTVNIGLIRGEEDRVKNFKNHHGIRYNFPMLNFTREQCEKILRANDLQVVKSGCYFCPKQPRESWIWLKENHPEKYLECEEMGWLTKLPHNHSSPRRASPEDELMVTQDAATQLA